MISFTRFFCVGMLGVGVLSLRAEQTTSSQGGISQTTGTAAPPVSVVNDPGYKLTVGDQISVQVYEEPSLGCNQLIDRDGIARLPWIGDTKLTGLTVREAEHAIEGIYHDRKMLKKPVVTLVVTGFMPREALFFGQGIGSPGPVPFARDVTVMDIVEVVTRAGGFRPGAKSSAVNVKHKDSTGHETITTVDVEAMISTRKIGDQKRTGFPIYPGDILEVGLRIF